MLQLEISLGLIKQGQTYLLQKRRDDPKLGASGLIGCFGGKVESGETPQQAAAREVSEETSLTLKPDDFEHAGKVEVVSDFNLEEIQVIAHVFRIAIDSETKVLATEGELVAVTPQDLPTYLDQLTPATRAVFENLIIEEA